MVIDHCGDEIDLSLRCIQSADLEVSVYLSDNSPEELTAERLKWSFPGLQVLTQEKNGGLYRAHNAVLPILRSKYHLIMDPAVSFTPSMLRMMVAYMESHPNIAVLSPRFTREDHSEIYYPRRKMSIRSLLGAQLHSLGGVFRRWQESYTFADHETEMPVPVESASSAFMLIRTDVFRSLSGFDDRFADTLGDADLCRRILDARLGSIVFHPDLQVLVRSTQHSAVYPYARRKHTLRTVLRYFLKWGITW